MFLIKLTKKNEEGKIKVCSCQADQLKLMKKAGWEELNKKIEPVEETDPETKTETETKKENKKK